MSQSPSSSTFLPPLALLWPASGAQAWLRHGLVAILGSLALWASAKIQVPFWPVPMTLQTYMVLALGALLGWRLGVATVALYLFEGALGLPVFAGTPAKGLGLIYMAGPTGGYLAGYLVATLAIGLLAARGGTANLLRTVLTLLVGEVIILGLGFLWLVPQFGFEKALAYGLGLFLYGDALKLALASATVLAANHWVARR